MILEDENAQAVRQHGPMQRVAGHEVFESSRGALDPQHILPRRFDHSVLQDEHVEAVNLLFDWDKHALRLVAGDRTHSVGLLPGTHDRLSYLLAARRLASAGEGARQIQIASPDATEKTRLEVAEEVDVEIDPSELKVDVYRSTGPGGQSVNTTDSAVRITHLPSGIVAQCQQEKSQHRNKDMAMKVLKARLYQQERQKQDDKLQELHDSKEDIAWGSQIRSYVLHPYQMVKDHRIKLDVGNVNDVLDGGIDRFIEGVLLAKKQA